MNTREVSTLVYVPLRDYETTYEVSSNGTIRNIRTKHVLQSSPTDTGYHQVKLGGRTQSLHRILAKHFLSDAYKATHPDAVFDDLVVDHIDRNERNNAISNLRICTQSDNMRNRRMRGYASPDDVYELPADAVPINIVKNGNNEPIIFMTNKYYHSLEKDQFYCRNERDYNKFLTIHTNNSNPRFPRINMRDINNKNKQICVHHILEQLYEDARL